LLRKSECLQIDPGWKRDENIKAKESDKQTINWFGEQLNKTIAEIEDQFQNSGFLMHCIWFIN
jgi:hypothetical protein